MAIATARHRSSFSVKIDYATTAAIGPSGNTRGDATLGIYSGAK